MTPVEQALHDAGAVFRDGFVHLPKPLDLSLLESEVSGSFAPDSEEEFRLGMQLGLVPGRIRAAERVKFTGLPIEEFWGGEFVSLFVDSNFKLKVVHQGLKVSGCAEFRSDTSLQAFRGPVEVGGYLDLSFCDSFESFGPKLRVGGHTYLVHPSDKFTGFPPRTRLGALHLTGCKGLTPRSLRGLTVDGEVNINNCPGLQGRGEEIKAVCKIGGRIWC